LSAILFYLYSEYLSKEFLEGFEDPKQGGQVIRTLKYSDDLLILAEEEVVLPSETGRCCALKRNVDKTKVKIISNLSFPIEIMVDK
jgi:hypothetical protein